MTQFPPDNYIATESKVSGITVYMPQPQTVEAGADAVVDFRCPNCDGITAYSAEDGGLTCAFCGHHEAPEQPVVGKNATEYEFTVTTVQRATHGWGAERKELECQRCGAHTTMGPDMLTHTCPFCGSNQVVQIKAQQNVLRPRFLIPFKLSNDDCHRQTREWLGSSWMTPGALKSTASVADFAAIYLPFWTFDARAVAGWKAEVGHTKTTSYWSNGKRHTRTTTVWRWESGNVNHFFDDLVVEGTDKLSTVLLQRVSNYDTRGLTPYEPQFLAGLHAQAFDIGLEAAWATSRERMREQTRQKCRSQASTSKIRNFSMNLDFAEESWRYVLLPVYIANYKFGSENFQVMVNGQTGKVGGQRPVDWVKVWLAMGLMVTPGLLLGLLALVTLIFGGLGAFIGIIALFALTVGGGWAWKTFQQAQAMDDV